MFLLGIIICVVYILYVLAEKKPEKGKPYMGFFTVRHFREIEDGELRRKVRVYRLAPAETKKPIKRKAAVKRLPSRNAPRYSQQNAPRRNSPAIPKSASVSQRVYYVDGRPTVSKPRELQK